MPGPGSQKGLKPFKKGQSGNPKGRPKKIPAIDALLADVLGKERGGKTEAEAILTALAMRARSGDVRAAEVLLDRAYGKPKQSIEHGNADGKPFMFGYGGNEDE